MIILGRSDETGIWSQQFVPAEGGFKSFFEESSANNYMISLNTSIGIWKWIEFYADLGALKIKVEIQSDILIQE